jgi:hypothetical protein
LSDQLEVKPEELYDGPVPHTNVTVFPQAASAAAKPLFSDQQPPEPVDHQQILRAIFEILSARVLGLVATIAACVIWGFAVYQPDTSRSLAALGFSLTVLGPIAALYWRTGHDRR